MAARSCSAALLILLSAASAGAESAACRRPSAAESALRLPATCSVMDSPALEGPIGVFEGDEATLLRAVNLVHKNKEDHVAVLFYANWCPFSRICKANFQRLSSLFPTVRHFAFEELVIRPSILSRYGVHGFPTLFLFNSTIRVRYHGSRTINSLAAFFNDVTGVNPASLGPMSVEKNLDSDVAELKEEIEQESCPFWRARSPEKLLQQDTYLALAASFVLLRLFYILLPKITPCVKWAWRRHMRRSASLMNIDDYFCGFVGRARRGLNRLNPCKRSNLHEGAMNARAWASKSLVPVSIGESSCGRALS